MRVLFIGDDWAEDHHDVELEDEGGRRLARARLPEGLEGITRLHALVAEHAPAAWAELPSEQVAGQVVVGIETDRGPWVTALRSAGYVVYAVNPLSAARYRERHSTSGAKSDAGDAHVLAEIVRLDRAHHRPIAGDSELADAVKLLARAHQNANLGAHSARAAAAFHAARVFPCRDRGVRGSDRQRHAEPAGADAEPGAGGQAHPWPADRRVARGTVPSRRGQSRGVAGGSAGASAAAAAGRWRARTPASSRARCGSSPRSTRRAPAWAR